MLVSFQRSLLVSRSNLQFTKVLKRRLVSIRLPKQTRQFCDKTRDENGVLSLGNNDEETQIHSNLDFQNWVTKVPFKRVAIWLFLGFLAHQLKDFFGVRKRVRLVSRP